jgi:predicted AlkP superfamily phosphohydrolase/phosphomutase
MTPPPRKPKLLLVGWDSADWKILNALLAEGGMDGIRSLMDGGSHGNLATLEPQLSPMLWTSIATGKMAYHHGVILAKGPGIAAGQDLHGARLLDVAPTLLHHFGLPVGDDMEGRVLREILTAKAAIRPNLHRNNSEALTA